MTRERSACQGVIERLLGRQLPDVRRRERTACAIETLERRVLFVLYGPDITFGNGGVAVGAVGNQVLSELPDGDILAVGVREFSSQGDLDVETSATRLNPDGT